MKLSLLQRGDGIDGGPILVAGVADIIKVEGARRDRMKKRISRNDKLEALKKESERALIDHWRLAPDKRSPFLRKRVRIQASCL
jgi:hypothetical protein